MILIVLALLAAPIAVTAVFIVELLAGLPRFRLSAALPREAVRTVLVMPAHDEAAILDGTLEAILPSLAGWATLLLVADNCHDDTAAIARRHGAVVIERTSATERGKGFALAFAQAHLRGNPPEAVIVLDADCASDAASLRALAQTAVRTGRPCQAINLIRPDLTAAPMVQLSSFAFMIKNLVRQRGLMRLGGRVHLTGTGMAFPWPLFDSAPLASGNIVEDVELGHALDRAGHPPLLVDAATVWSDPASAAGTLVQRKRWEGGFLALARKQAPAALRTALVRRDPRALAAALDLCVPPLTLLALVDAAVLVVAVVLTWLSGAAWWPVLFHLAVCAAALLCIIVAWGREGRAFIRLGALLRIPLYILWKIPLYLGLVRGSPSEWLRAGR